MVVRRGHTKKNVCSVGGKNKDSVGGNNKYFLNNYFTTELKNNDRGPIENLGLHALSYYPCVVRPIPLQMKIESDRNLLTFADLLNG